MNSFKTDCKIKQKLKLANFFFQITKYLLKSLILQGLVILLKGNPVRIKTMPELYPQL